MLQVAGRLHLSLLVGESSAVLSALGLQDRHLDLDAEIADVRTVLAAVAEVTG